MVSCDIEKKIGLARSSTFRLPDPDFPRDCVVIRIYSRPNPRYHCPFYMMTKTLLSDGRRTRPRFAAATPTPPKFLIATFQQSKNHSTPSKQTTNPNPNGNKARVSRPPWRIGDSPWRFAASAISRPRPLFGLIPLAQPHPRKPSGLSPSLGFTPFAQLHPRKPLTPLPASFLYRWPPAGVFEVLPTSRPLFGLIPLAQPHPRNLDSPQRTRLSRPAPPRGIDGLGISRPSSGLAPLAPFHPRNLPPFYGIPFKSGTALSPRPLALPHLRNAVTLLSALFLYHWPPAGAFEVLPTSRPQAGLTPLAQPHPRNELSARARSAETSKTPARCRRHKNQPLALTFALEAPLATAFLIVTPRLEIAATARETNEMQNSNRYKMTVLQPPPQIALIQRGANDASPSPLKILIANLELEFELTHRELSPLKIPNRKYFAVFHPDCRREFLPQELRA